MVPWPPFQTTQGRVLTRLRDGPPPANAPSGHPRWSSGRFTGSLGLSERGSGGMGGTPLLDDGTWGTDSGWGFESLFRVRKEAGLTHKHGSTKARGT